MTRRRLLSIRTVAVVLLAVAIAACSHGSPIPAAPRNASVLLVTIDTWRWDHVGVSGEGRVKTPNLDRLAAEGTYVEKIQTTCPLTTPAHATILTGLLPAVHGIRDNLHFKLKPGVLTLAERFKRAGFATGAVISGAPLRRVYGLDRGFDAYDDSGLAPQTGGSLLTPLSRPAAETTAHALGWLKQQPRDARVFLWVHYYDPHDPYRPPEPFATAYAGHPYAGEVAAVDDRIGPLLDAVRADAARSWVVAVTGDHGEGLGDHGERTHGILLYESTVEVPLIVWPGRKLAKDAGPFSLVDVAPTLAALAGLPGAPTDGVSIFSDTPAGRWLAAETAYPALGHGVNPGYLLRRGSLVALRQGTEEVYDLAADPGETRNVLDTDRGREISRQAAATLETRFGPERELFDATLALTAGELDALRGLGYTTGPQPGRRALRAMDLRTLATELGRLDTARGLFSSHRAAEALREYNAFLATLPESALALQERGQVLASLGRLDEAASSFARALVLDPSDAVSALDLGNLALARGDARSAESFFLKSVAIEDAQPEAHLNLGLLYLYKLNRPKDAKPHFARFLELAPDDPEAEKVRGIAASL